MFGGHGSWIYLVSFPGVLLLILFFVQLIWFTTMPTHSQHAIKTPSLQLLSSSHKKIWWLFVTIVLCTLNVVHHYASLPNCTLPTCHKTSFLAIAVKFSSGNLLALRGGVTF